MIMITNSNLETKSKSYMLKKYVERERNSCVIRGLLDSAVVDELPHVKAGGRYSIFETNVWPLSGQLRNSSSIC